MLLLPLVAALILQEPAPIRVTTRMAEVGVLVHDERGRAVTGLSAQDFHLMDGGREETIRSFSAAGPGRRKAPAESRVATAILLDFFNSAFKNESYGRGQLVRFLREVEPQHPIALLSLDAGFQVLHEFSTDAASLARALERYRPYRPIQAGAFRPLKTGFPTIDELDRKVEMLKAQGRSRETASAMAALAAFLARTPGRKNLIWVSSVFPGALAAGIRTEDVAVYPVDVTTPIDGPRPSARMLAERTGGVAFDHGNDLLGGIRQADEDSDSVYVLGYYPSHGEWNGRPRRIEVRVNRRGAEVRHRAGYVAALGDTFEVPDQRETLLHLALSPVEVQGIGVTAKAARVGDGTVEVAFAVDGRTLSSRAGPGSERDLEVLLVPAATAAKRENAQYRVLQGSTGGIRANERIAAPAGTRQVRVVVREMQTGALGSATASVK